MTPRRSGGVDSPNASWERVGSGRNLGRRAVSAEADVDLDEQPAAGGDTARDEAFHEAAALDEIELFSELLIATGGRSAPLSRRELDALLGIRS